MPGIDLLRYYDDVGRILRARYGARIARLEEMEFDDVLQDVYRSLLARNAGRNPWDPERGLAASTYIFRVCGSVVCNLEERQAPIGRPKGPPYRDKWMTARAIDDWTESSVVYLDPHPNGAHTDVPIAAGNAVKVRAVEAVHPCSTRTHVWTGGTLVRVAAGRPEVSRRRRSRRKTSAREIRGYHRHTAIHQWRASTHCPDSPTAAGIG